MLIRNFRKFQKKNLTILALKIALLKIWLFKEMTYRFFFKNPVHPSPLSLASSEEYPMVPIIFGFFFHC